MKKKAIQKNSIVIYKDKKGNVSLNADIKKETIWATQAQIAEIFNIDRTVVTKHIKNILKNKEFDQNSVCAFFAHTSSDRKNYKVQFYNLDIILAVGYRANSIQAINFRKWANKILRDYILKGVAVNTERIKKLHKEGLKDLQSKIDFIQKTIQKRDLNGVEVDSLLSVIKDYSNSFALLRKYDDGDISIQKSKLKERKKINYESVRPSIEELKARLMKEGEASNLFGNERDESFKGILKTIYQTFEGKELYESLEEKASHLLYFIIKDHPFSDGNKRIGSFLFVLFLDINKILYRKNGEKKISDNTLVALALLVAESNPKEKETIIALITNLII